MYTYELFEIEDGYGFVILMDGSITIRQEYQPDVDGFVIMDEATAVLYANTLIGRIQGSAVQ